MNDDKFKQEVIQSLARIEAFSVADSKRIRDLEDDVYGNGDGGLKERTARLEERTGGGKVVGAASGGVAALVLMVGRWLAG